MKLFEIRNIIDALGQYPSAYDPNLTATEGKKLLQRLQKAKQDKQDKKKKKK